ncbi:alpha/beta hydrolase [Conyzicola nivalis]|uniref:Hydrolase n=1 Tax=Conyzicola nivalis TaxID=1477021 RepID=A0A916WKM8_9MICO|nr:alpha/beta hydrolase [Conyzicola nivalis]GGB07064.1 hydrolase [Conyzicola nivalis]
MTTIEVPDGQLHYEVRGSGPHLLITGSPMKAAEFAALADALADDHTVVTHDPRGIGGSSLDDPDAPSQPELRARDLVTLLDHLKADTVDVFGSSGGAVTGLALVADYPGRVRTLIAHEPPLLELLPDAGRWRGEIEQIVTIFHEQGAGAAWGAFMKSAGFVQEGDTPPPPPEPRPEPTEQELADTARFFDHDLRATTRYLPDIPALVTGNTRVVVGIGVDSGHLNTYQTSMALATLLAEPPVTFPGDHAGFLGDPAGFAGVIREVLENDPAVN